MDRNYKINEETGNRLYSLTDGYIPQFCYVDYSTDPDCDYFVSKSYDVWVYPQGNRDEKVFTHMAGISSSMCWMGVSICMDDEWEYEGEDKGFIDYGIEKLKKEVEGK